MDQNFFHRTQESNSRAQKSPLLGRRLLKLWLLPFVLLLTAGPAFPEPAVKLAAAGDIQLGRGMREIISQRGGDYPFHATAGILRRADITFGNLECALSRDATPLPKRFSFKADPARAGDLATAGFDVLSLANNHSLDCGRGALAETLAALRQNHISPVGAGADAKAAEAPVILERNDIKIAFLARSMVPTEGIIYREDAPTGASFDAEEILGAIRAARKQADIVIVSLHWGIEYARQPQEEQRRLAHQMIDAGASLIIGHHPHTPQPLEWYRGGVIAYSLGNFVFDASRDRARAGAILECTLTRRGVASAQLRPILIFQGQPRLRTK
jgi:poly-gamma-glutamate capsule biosynthesis protein CapA/YwtB (metallophosphatase superfamily)